MMLAIDCENVKDLRMHLNFFQIYILNLKKSRNNQCFPKHAYISTIIGTVHAYEVAYKFYECEGSQDALKLCSNLDSQKNL